MSNVPIENNQVPPAPEAPPLLAYNPIVPPPPGVNSRLTKKFLEGLKKYNLTYDDIIKSGWKYCGGDTGRHYNYYKICRKDADLPGHKDNCVCGHYIEENCYITNGERILVLGNCCIKKFVPKHSRTCEECGVTHRNRKVNRCNACKMFLY